MDDPLRSEVIEEFLLPSIVAERPYRSSPLVVVVVGLFRSLPPPVLGVVRLVRLSELEVPAVVVIRLLLVEGVLFWLLLGLTLL
ncbi:MAG: hypothetical protein O3C43_09625 [Verrucomicrobia bacterium]|nr:hypothetical protein [Verrucomicrobiota bacterium]